MESIGVRSGPGGGLVNFSQGYWNEWSFFVAKSYWRNQNGDGSPGTPIEQTRFISLMA